MKDRRSVFKEALFWLILLTMVLASARIGWVYLYPYKPAIIHGAITVSPSIARAGDEVHYKVDYEKLMDVPCIVTRTLVNNRLFDYTPKEQHFPVGRRVVERPLDVPHSAHGECRIYFVLDYTVSSYPTRIVRITKWSEPFTVVP